MNRKLYYIIPIILGIIFTCYINAFSFKKVNLKDAITILQVCAGLQINFVEKMDINLDNNISLKDAILVLQVISSLKDNPLLEVSLGDLGKPSDYNETIIGMENFISDYDTFLDQIPDSFDWRDRNAVNPARNQGECGSCWAFASVGAMESKIKIKTGELYDLSEQQQVSCNIEMKGCKGGNSRALKFWNTKGPILEKCGKYANTDSIQCYDLSNCVELMYNTIQYYTVETDNINEVKSSIYTDGPTYFRFDVYPDFIEFWYSALPDDVYTHKKDENMSGGHAVLIIGWNESKKAWLCKNSWGISSGPNRDGTFYIAWSGHSNDLRFGMANVGLKGNLSLRLPNGGEEWCTGDTNIIEWDTGNAGNYVKIDLFKGEKLLMTINESTINNGIYQWNIPKDFSLGDNYLIRITDTEDKSVYDESNSKFSIIDNCKLELTSPNGGESWYKNETKTIHWIPGKTGTTVNIYLLKKTEEMMIRLAQGTKNDGLYVWSIPETLQEGDDYKIYIKLYNDSNIFDDSDDFFSIINKNKPPTANAGIDQMIEEGELIYLHGSGNDSDGNIESYEWEQISGIPVTINNAENFLAFFKAPQVKPIGENLVFQLTVKDNDGQSDNDSCTINIFDVPGTIRNIHIKSEHTINEPCRYTEFAVAWDSPLEYTETSYYYKLSTSLSHYFDINDIDGTLTENPFASLKVNNKNDVAYFFHVASTIYNVNALKTIIGDVITLGPIRIDDIPPYDCLINAPETTVNKLISLKLAATGASWMNISSISYGGNEWEPFNTIKEYLLADQPGMNTIYVQFKDSAGNVTNVSTTIFQIKEYSLFSNSIGMTFVLIPPGTFMMGSPESEDGRDGDERLHEVTLTSAYYIQTTEITQKQYKTLFGINHSSYVTSCGDNCPLVEISWGDCQSIIEKLNDIEEYKYRLPTEAEWEYAARAGTNTAFSFGNCLSTDEANYNGNYPLEGCPKGIDRYKPIAVASLKANKWGIYDMHGNVWEWCQDWYTINYPSESVVDPIGPSSGSFRVIRGGCTGGAIYSRSASRAPYSPGKTGNRVGTRLLKIFP